MTIKPSMRYAPDCKRCGHPAEDHVMAGCKWFHRAVVIDGPDISFTEDPCECPGYTRRKPSKGKSGA